MRKVETAGELIVGESYWIYAKDAMLPSNNGVLVEVKLDSLTAMGNEVKYIGNRIWCVPGNNQVLDKYHVFGPYPKPSVSREFTLVEEYRDIAAMQLQTIFDGFMDGSIECEGDATTYNEKYRGNEWAITTHFFNHGGKHELPIASVYIDNRLLPVEFAYSIPEAIAIARKAIDLYNDDPERFEVEYRGKLAREVASEAARDKAGQDAAASAEGEHPGQGSLDYDPSVDSSCVTGNCGEPAVKTFDPDALGLKPASEIESHGPKTDEGEVVPEIDIDDDEIPF